MAAVPSFFLFPGDPRERLDRGLCLPVRSPSRADRDRWRRPIPLSYGRLPAGLLFHFAKEARLMSEDDAAVVTEAEAAGQAQLLEIATQIEAISTQLLAVHDSFPVSP